MIRVRNPLYFHGSRAPSGHGALVRVYLFISLKFQCSDDTVTESYQRLLIFANSIDHYRPDRLQIP